MEEKNSPEVLIDHYKNASEEEKKQTEFKGFGANNYTVANEPVAKVENKAKSYEEMTNEEKLAFLEKEREFLLKEKANKEEQPSQLKIGTK